VLIKSSNIGAYKFARQLGPKRFYEYTENWGFGRKTGIQLSGESSGIASNTEQCRGFLPRQLWLCAQRDAAADGLRLFRDRQ
jgi:cell division protein FtsI/penicillin-binding protein 2